MKNRELQIARDNVSALMNNKFSFESKNITQNAVTGHYKNR